MTKTATELWRGHRHRRQDDDTQRALELLLEAQFHLRRDPETLARELGEMDSHLMDVIMQQKGWTRLGGAFGSEMKITDADRLAEVAQARYMTYHDAQSKNAVQTWTDFGLGQSVRVVPRDTKAIEVWNEFWLARRNKPILGERVLHEQSNEVVKSGELFYPMSTNTASGLEPGETTIRQLLTEQIRSPIITLPDDPFVNVWYVQNVDSVRQGDETYDGVAFRDWLATDEDVEEVGGVPDGTIDASELRPNTKVVMLYAARNRYLVDGTQYRGFPEFKQAYEWYRANKDALGDILAKVKAVAMYIDTLTLKGGSRALDAIRTQLTSTLGSGTNRLEQNPTPVAGSTWLQNEQADRTRMPLSTAANDDRVVTGLVLAQAAAATQVPIGWVRPDMWQNRSVAEMTILPWNETMQRYQAWWASVFRDMAQIVLQDFEPDKREVDVTLDTLITVAITDLLAVIAGTTDAAAKGIIDPQEAGEIIKRVAKLALTKFGIVDVDEVLEPGKKPPRKDDDDEPDDAVERLVHSAIESLSEGTDAQAVAEWALGELLVRFTG